MLAFGFGNSGLRVRAILTRLGAIFHRGRESSAPLRALGAGRAIKRGGEGRSGQLAAVRHTTKLDIGPLKAMSHWRHNNRPQNRTYPHRTARVTS